MTDRGERHGAAEEPETGGSAARSPLDPKRKPAKGRKQFDAPENKLIDAPENKGGRKRKK
jgi:hypothetical protein